jgi:hypothetical protein
MWIVSRLFSIGWWLKINQFGNIHTLLEEKSAPASTAE